MLIDTHAHLFALAENDLVGVIERARSVGVTKFVVPGLNLETSQKAIELARKYPGVIYATVGIHPEEIVTNHLLFNISYLAKLFEENRQWVVAIGEIGTDANNPEMIENMSWQQELFRAQCEMAIKLDLPVVIHTRKSLKETFAVLDGLPKMPRGVFHSFSHDEAGLQEILKRGFYIGLGGSVSYSKRIQNISKLVPSDRYLLETDTPYLPRDLVNEPSSVTILASLIGNLRGENVNIVAENTTNNAERLFNL
jgi:TatD DNase family protein